MDHNKGLIGFFDCLGYDRTLNVSAIYEIMLKAAVSSGNIWLCHVPGNLHTVPFCLDWQQIGRNIPPVDMVQNVLQTSVSGGR